MLPRSHSPHNAMHSPNYNICVTLRNATCILPVGSCILFVRSAGEHSNLGLGSLQGGCARLTFSNQGLIKFLISFSESRDFS